LSERFRYTRVRRYSSLRRNNYAWVKGLHQRYGDHIAVAVELTKGPIVSALQKYDFIDIFPVNPSSLAKYREAFQPRRAKDDPTDAQLAVDMLLRHSEHFKVLKPQSVEMRTRAATVFRKAHLREGIVDDALVLHSDNGSPMKGATMLATLQRLGVMPSFSRPSVSDDNPYSEALFKTLKHHPGYPDKPFENFEDTRRWVFRFEHWFNEIHRHSALRFVTPGQRHRGEDINFLARRQVLYEATKTRHPERWSGSTRNWKPEEIVNLNPGKRPKTEADFKRKVA
jgi:hypothetical protein